MKTARQELALSFDVNDVVVVVFGVSVVVELLLYYCYVIMFMFGAHHNNI